MDALSMNVRISDPIRKVRRLLSRCAEQFSDFDVEIDRILALQSATDYSSIIDSFYKFEDTELAKQHFRNTGFGTDASKPDFGLVYLKFYGLMNACYLQQQAVLVCNRRLRLNTDLARVNASPLIQYRHDFAAHSPNRGRGKAEHSYILDRFGLLEGRIAGYSSNSPNGFASKDEKLLDLLDNWDDCFAEALAPVCQYITNCIQAAGVNET